MSKNESEWEKIWENFVLHDAVLAVVASPEVGDKFEPEKYNYANQKLNDLNGYIYTRGKDVIQEILSNREKEIAEKVKLIKCLLVVAGENEQDTMDDAKQHGHDQACDKVLSILKHQ